MLSLRDQNVISLSKTEKLIHHKTKINRNKIKIAICSTNRGNDILSNDEFMLSDQSKTMRNIS